MTKENKDKIIDRVIDFLHNKPLKSDMRIAASLIEELKLVKNCSIPDVSRSFAFGECVKVLHCFHGHEFQIGEIVCIVGKSDYDDAWLCRNAKGVEWYLHDEEGDVVNCG